tara:strand:+ start:8618 stop:9007 length:390 start_codon:yes stop_codon:yes gene_type:complete
MCYFEPGNPPPYFRRHGVTLPHFVQCCLKPCYGTEFAGYSRQDCTTIVETWFIASQTQQPWIDYRNPRTIRTSPREDVAWDGEHRLQLIEPEAIELPFAIFVARHKAITDELRRMNHHRLLAFEAISNG